MAVTWCTFLVTDTSGCGVSVAVLFDCEWLHTSFYKANVSNTGDSVALFGFAANTSTSGNVAANRQHKLRRAASTAHTSTGIMTGGWLARELLAPG